MFGLAILIIIFPCYASYSAWYLHQNNMGINIKNISIFVITGFAAGILSCLAMFATWAIAAPNSLSNNSTGSYAFYFFAIMASAAYFAVWTSGYAVKKYNKVINYAPTAPDAATQRRL